ncbi:MAG: alpha/beta hydrolase fold domain-containing protein [Prevotella sp.]|nr:alpha/beta hydrolase fold domain-containing protein [Prevotella sp.]
MKRLLLFACALVVMTVQAQTARKFTVNITPDGASNMVAYLPDMPTGRAVVDCPGGGYSHLALQHEGHDWAAYFNKQGIAYFVLTYRMPKGNRDIPLSDAQTAIRMVRDSADFWHVNPYDVGIMGFSAGGHLASSVSTHSEFDCRPNFSILFYPVISMNPREGHRGSSEGFLGKAGLENEQLVKEWSNQNAVRRHLTPPAIIFTASDDQVVPVITNCMRYYESMRRAGNDCAMYVYPTGGHGFGFRDSWTYHNQMLNDLTTWLNAHKAPRKDAIRVACIGNSITDGSGIDMADLKGYPAQLQKLLGKGYHVKNYGVGARTMLNNGDHPYMIELAWRDAQAFQPNIVVIKLGTNDSKDFIWSKHSKEFAGDMQTMVNALRKLPSNPKIYLCTPIKAFRDKWGITDSVIVNGVIPAIRQVAKKNKLTVIDLHAVLTDEASMTHDMIHPNEKGAGQMAKAIADAIRLKE